MTSGYSVQENESGAQHEIDLCFAELIQGHFGHVGHRGWWEELSEARSEPAAAPLPACNLFGINRYHGTVKDPGSNRDDHHTDDGSPYLLQAQGLPSLCSKYDVQKSLCRQPKEGNERTPRGATP
jgi:hypothetical protein